MSFTNAVHEENYQSKSLPYKFKFYLTFEYTYGLFNQENYTALSNDDPDANIECKFSTTKYRIKYKILTVVFCFPGNCTYDLNRTLHSINSW